MGILDIFKKHKESARSYERMRELGGYYAAFSNFGTDAYKSDVVRSAIRPLSELSAKATARCENKEIEKLINEKPNKYMNGKDFIAKVRTMLELTNTCFIYIERNDAGKAISLYPIPYASYEGLEYMGRDFIRFEFWGDAARQLVLPWEDLAVLRKDYNRYDIGGDSNAALLPAVQRVTTTYEGLTHAVKSTANLRGLLKSTKGMLSEDDRKKQRDAFVRDYMSIDNSGGIAALDGTMEFIPIKMEPTIASAEQMKEFKKDIYNYFGVNEAIIDGSISDAQLEVFYELRIEPFLVALSKELSNKIYIGKSASYDVNTIIFEANKLQFSSLEKKIMMFKEVVLYSGLTINEWREACNMPPVEWGDKPIRRLDAAGVKGDEKDD